MAMEDINYWMSKCVSLQQELDIANEKLANASIVHWHTGEPKKKGEYLVNYTDGSIGIADYHYWKWQFYNNRVVAWCKLSDIEPYKEGKK